MAERSYFNRRIAALEKERSSFVPTWRETAHWIDPTKGKFVTQKGNGAHPNDGTRRNKQIINSRATMAKRAATSGMMAGTMSPSQPWFKLETLTRPLMSSSAVAQWVFSVEEAINNVLLESNFYNMVAVFLDELLTFGTAAMSHVDDDQSVARFYTHTAGSYLIGVDDRGDVNTFVLQKMMQASVMEQKFGKDNLSPAVRQAVEGGNKDGWFKVTQFIEPNPDFDPEKLESKFKRFRSVWFEEGNNENKFLREEGFDDFPVYVVRWSLVGEDVYGTNSPALVALGDIKGLQEQEKQKAIGIAKQMSPLLKGPASLRNLDIPNAPGGLIAFDNDDPRGGLTSVFQINPAVQELRVDMDAIERRINEAFFVDLFFAISSMQGIQPRNQLEITQRNQEALLILGPVLERIQREFASPLIERVFNQLADNELLPEPPEELRGESLDTRFISSLAQAQRSSQVGTLERHAEFVARMAQIDPNSTIKFNTDEAIEFHARATGVVPSVNNDAEQVAAIREQIAQAQQAQQEAETQNQEAQANERNASAARQLEEADNV